MIDYGLSSQQLEVISALSNGATMTAAADAAGIHRNTICNWRRNYLHFQQALADAQYDRALLFREKTEALIDLAVETIHNLLADANAPASVRLKAALAVIQIASAPPALKKAVEIDIEKIVVKRTEPQTITEDQIGPAPPAPEKVHNPAQTIRRELPKVGRNDPCPCGSGIKYKRCCLDQHTAA